MGIDKSTIIASSIMFAVWTAIYAVTGYVLHTHFHMSMLSSILLGIAIPGVIGTVGIYTFLCALAALPKK
ncbi:MAG: hypothetical protein EBZ49_00660 [Proteobacteria bacterium]|nr:hypothetical protein [Pseudomonadota bacterium]